MSIFSKKITTDKISESLKGFFDVGYSSLVVGLKDTLKDFHIKINKEQDKELITVTMFAIIRAVITSLGNSPAIKNIIGKFQSDIFNEYFKDTRERDKFKELFWKRCDEYSEILNPENQDLALQFGQIFCNNFFGKEENGSHLAIMMLIGSSFLNQMTETKKFLDEISSKYEII